MGRRAIWFVFAGFLILVLLGIGLGGIGLMGRAYSERYAGRIYPGVSVYGIDVGGMTVDEATATLGGQLPHPASLSIALYYGNESWTYTWTDLGLAFEPEATARWAFQAGRHEGRDEERRIQLWARLVGWPVSPVVVLADAEQAIQTLEEVKPAVEVPPINAGLIIEPGRVAPTQAEVGRTLDVEASLLALTQSIEFTAEGARVGVKTRQTKPAILQPGQAQARAEALLARPFRLSARDPLTEISQTLSIPPDVVATWLVAEPTQTISGAQIEIRAQASRISATLGSNALASQLPETVALDAEKTTPAVVAALEENVHHAKARLSHPPTTYVVQPGDTLTSIGRAHGFPAWWIQRANPDLDPDTLHAGQSVIIPSIDILFDHPLITHKRIVVDISDQHVYAYENDVLVHDFVASTGIESSPTLTGTFQVLDREENAYASNWDLWMPHFIAVYRSGPGFTNGFHGLPTLSNGRRLWEGHLGRPVSYGCIVLGLEEAATLYQWVELGTQVIIRE